MALTAIHRADQEDRETRIVTVAIVNGKTNVPSDADALSTLTGTAKEAFRLAAHKLPVKTKMIAREESFR